MKTYSFSIDKWQAEQLFSPIRKKEQVINLLMKTIKIMLINDKLSEKLISGKIVLVVSKMSRLFYFSENKYFSINFPFSVIKNNNEFIFSSETIAEIDSKISSDVISVISELNDSENNYSIYGFLESIEKISPDKQNFWELILKLFLFEEGYIRYDYDEKHVNGRKHPLNHYDVFYTSNATFKIGLHKRITEKLLIDFLQLESDCHFLEKL